MPLRQERRAAGPLVLRQRVLPVLPARVPRRPVGPERATPDGRPGPGRQLLPAGGLHRRDVLDRRTGPVRCRGADPLVGWSDFAAAGALAGNASRSLRTTGASMVEDGDLTNSPMSVSFAMISLLVLPSSFASSCTRALPATALLRDEGGGRS